MAVIGSANGNFTQTAYNTLDAALTTAKVAKNNSGATQSTIDAATQTLNTAISTFNRSALVVAAVTTYTVTTSASTGGTVTGGGPYAANASANLVATANPGYTFTDWTDPSGNSISTSNPFIFTVAGDYMTFRANFAVVNSNPLTLSLTANNVANNLNIAKATAVTLRWAVTGSPTSCTANGSWTGAKAKAGGAQAMGQISANKTYTLVCQNASGESVSSTVTLTLSPTAAVNGVASNTASIWDAIWSFFTGK